MAFNPKSYVWYIAYVSEHISVNGTTSNLRLCMMDVQVLNTHCRTRCLRIADKECRYVSMSACKHYSFGVLFPCTKSEH